MVKYSRVKLNPYFKVFFHYNAVFIDLKSLIPKNRVIAPTSPKIAFFFFIFADPLYAEFSERRLFPPGEKIQFKRWRCLPRQSGRWSTNIQKYIWHVYLVSILILAGVNTNRSIHRKQTHRTCWTIETHSDELTWARRGTFHELISLSLVRLMKSSTFGQGLRFTFMAGSGKRQFVPRDEVFRLLVVSCLLYA